MGKDVARKIMLARLDIIEDDEVDSEYINALLDDAVGELEGKGIRLAEIPQDNMLVGSLAAHRLLCRDKDGDDPEWLSKMINRRVIEGTPEKAQRWR